MNNDSLILKEIIKLINEKSSFLITSHQSPDGDAIGSQLALAKLLRGLGKNVEIINVDSPPKIYSFLPGVQDIIVSNVVNRNYEVTFIVDCGDILRTNLFEGRREQLGIIVNIDHHLSNSCFGDINWVNKEVSSTAELVLEIAKGLKSEIDLDIAENLYTAIFTDTGSFQYSNTTPKTFRIASDLLKVGVNPHKISEKVYGVNPFSKLKLLGLTLVDMEKSDDGLVSWMTIPKEYFDKTKATIEDTEGFINYPRSIDGVELAILFKETSPNYCKVSFRSGGKVNVSNLAAKFGGGGHHNAAGSVVSGKLNEVKERVLAEAMQIFKSGNKIQ